MTSQQQQQQELLEQPLLSTGSTCTNANIQDTNDTALSPTTAVTNRSQNNNINSSSSSSDDDDDKNITLHLPSWCWCWWGRSPEEPATRTIISMNHNVFLELVLCVTYGMSDSLWTGTVLAAYLKKLGHSQNAWVGNVEAANGLASLVSALPVGYLADTLPGGRSLVLKCGGLLLVATAVLNAWLLEWIGTDQAQDTSPPRNTELYLAGIMALWGIGGGIVNGPAQALFADSTPQGKRSLYYMYLFVCYEVASCLGPLVSIALFQILGDDWDLYDLRIVMYVGMAMEMVNGVLMMFFDDKKALDESDAANECDDCDDNDNEAEEVVEGVCAPDTSNNDEEQLLSSGEPVLLQNNNRSNDRSDTDGSSSSNPPANRAWMIPYIIFVHSLVFALGSGMTVKFFPLFFKDQVGMSPSQVQVVYFILPLVLAGCSGIGQTISSQGGLGRVGTALLFKIMGVSGLYSMVVFKDYLDNHALLLVPIYIMRTALMNASYPLEESILMDFVPKHQRGRWKSLESIAAFGWCGSAALGGWTSDHAHGDYTYTFRITAMIQSLGIVTWALLLPLVPRREESHSDPQEQPRQSRVDNDHAMDQEITGSDNDNGPVANTFDETERQSGLAPTETAESFESAQLGLAATSTTPSFESALQEPLLSQSSAASEVG